MRSLSQGGSIVPRRSPVSPRRRGRSSREHGCLIVMGSEGRGEQTFRTDQDNGLILSEPIPEQDLAKFRADLFDALETCGFPPCPGEVMVRNPLWSKTVAEFGDDFRRWLALSDA